MGLDISAYRKLERVGSAKNGEEYEDKFDWRTHVFVYPVQDYPDRLPPIEPGAVYHHAAPRFDFRAGSYSGYNRWREQLSMMALGVMPRTVWKDEKTYAGNPFFELINFSDCEGVIGTDVSRKLAQDFAAFQARANKHEDEWFSQKYADWRKAFEMASDGGLVNFH